MAESLDLMNTQMVHLPTASVHHITIRKSDGSGWWLADGGGLSNQAIDCGDWLPLAVVVALARERLAEGADRG